MSYKLFINLATINHSFWYKSNYVQSKYVHQWSKECKSQWTCMRYIKNDNRIWMIRSRSRVKVVKKNRIEA